MRIFLFSICQNSFICIWLIFIYLFSLTIQFSSAQPSVYFLIKGSFIKWLWFSQYCSLNALYWISTNCENYLSLFALINADSNWTFAGEMHLLDTAHIYSSKAIIFHFLEFVSIILTLFLYLLLVFHVIMLLFFV